MRKLKIWYLEKMIVWTRSDLRQYRHEVDDLYREIDLAYIKQRNLEARLNVARHG